MNSEPNEYADSPNGKRPCARLSAPIAGKSPPIAAARAIMQKAVLRTGKSTSVVQLGAYSSSARVAGAWNAAARRYSGLKNYAPVSARFSTE